MGLAFYDSEQEVFGADPLRSFTDGHLGEVYEQIIYLRNDDPATYYTNLVLSYIVVAYDDLGEFGTTGWGIKFMYGQRRPTEAEWDLVRSGDPISLPDIGTTTLADISTFHPIWVRIVCPGGTAAQLRENQRLELTYYPRMVGA
jgi:hypothetical protein